MKSQTDGLLVQRALHQFSPEVFLHPVWVRFAASALSQPAEQIQPLARAVKQMLAERDVPGACSVLFLCAARQSWLGDYPAALESINQSIKMAKRHHLQNIVMWGYWGASAVCAQQGEYLRAANYLNNLQAMIVTGDWVLADLVEMITQALERMDDDRPRHSLKADVPLLANPLLQPVLNALFQWGQATSNGKTPYQYQPIVPSSSRLNGWRQVWERLQQWIHGSLQPDAARQVSSNIPVPVSGGEMTLAPTEDILALAYPEDIEPDAGQSLPESASISVVDEPIAAEQGALRKANEAEAGAEANLPQLPALPASIAPHPNFPLPEEIPGSTQGKPDPGIPGKPALAVYFFGSFRLYQDDQLVADWPGQKSLAILKYLAANHRKPVAKDILMDYFWADAETEVARRNLHQAIYALRQVLKRGWPSFPSILFENDCYLLNPGLELWLDFEAFDSHVQAARRLEEAGSISQAVTEYGIAQELYPGDFLEEDLYEDWPNAQRTYYRTMYMDLLNRLCGYYIQQQQYYPAITLCQKILAKDNCAEQAYRYLIQCYLAQGQRQLAIREYQTCVQTMKQELNLAPSNETRALYAQITATQYGAKRKE